jgi:hypothetical protein
MTRHFFRLRSWAPSAGRALACLVLTAAIFAAGAARAETEDPRYRTDGPYYNPHTKSYFEIRRDRRNPNWDQAKGIASTHVYKGARGRLGVIRDAQTMAWIDKTFPVRGEVWIGLSFWCKSRRLLWTTGEEHPLTAYSNWNRGRWYRNDGINCNVTDRVTYMPVALRADHGRYYWQANGTIKRFNGYLVEYPTGTE